MSGSCSCIHTYQDYGGISSHPILQATPTQREGGGDLGHHPEWGGGWGRERVEGRLSYLPYTLYRPIPPTVTESLIQRIIERGRINIETNAYSSWKM